MKNTYIFDIIFIDKTEKENKFKVIVFIKIENL